MEVKRQLDVLDRALDENDYLCGDEYTIADMAVFAWYGALVIHDLYAASEFLSVASYKNVVRWAHQIAARPAVKLGKRVNKVWGPEDEQVAERQSAAGLD